MLSARAANPGSVRRPTWTELMSKFSLQFHASPEEQHDLALGIRRELRAHAAADIVGSNEVVMLDDQMDATGTVPAGTWRIHFTLSTPPRWQIRGMHIDDPERECLILGLGRLEGGKLQESWFATFGEEESSSQKWSALARKLKARFLKGGFAQVPGGDPPEQFYKSVRFLPGALALQRQGVCMIRAGGRAGVRLCDGEGDRPA